MTAIRGIKRQTLAGPFAAQELASGIWRLAVGGPDGAEVWVRGIGADIAHWLERTPIVALAVEWGPEGVGVTATHAGGVRQFVATTVLVHASTPRLYDALPLAGFGPDAQRFWRRIFRLVRFPGGRWLLGFYKRT